MAFCCNINLYTCISLCPADVDILTKILLFGFFRIVQDRGMVKRHSRAPYYRNCDQEGDDGYLVSRRYLAWPLASYS